MLDKNLSVLQRRHPELAKQIKNIPSTGRYKLFKSQRKDNLPTLIDTKSNSYYYNTIDPVNQAELDIAGRKINLGNVAIFLGFGLGYQIVEYLNKHSTATILIIEKDLEVLKLAMSTLDLRSLVGYDKVHFIAGVPIPRMYPSVFTFLRRDTVVAYLKSINIIEQAAILKSDKEYYINSIRVIKEGINGVLGLYGNDPYDSLLGIKFTVRNLATIIDNPGIKDLQDVFKGKPGVVVATGPSLNKNAHLLEGIYDKAVIVGADASAKSLKSKGLKPAHLVTSLERVIQTSYLFEGLTEEDTKDSYLAACPVIMPETYAMWPGEKVIVYRDFATFKWIDIPKGQLGIGPSSGNMAFKVLEYLGCDPIILIGQDLAYAEDMRSHASGTHYGEEADTKRFKHITLKGNYVDEVTSTPVWKSFLKYYEKDIAEYKGTVINATEGGAKIIGTELMTFQEAIDKYITKDINAVDVIKDKLKPISNDVKKLQFAATMQKLEDAIAYCDEVVSKLDVGLEECQAFNSFLISCGKSITQEQAEQAIKISENAGAAMVAVKDKRFYLILMHYVQSFFIKSIIDINGLKHAEPRGLELSVKLTPKLAKTCKILRELIIKMEDELKIAKDKLEEDIKNHQL